MAIFSRCGRVARLHGPREAGDRQPHDDLRLEEALGDAIDAHRDPEREADEECQGEPCPDSQEGGFVHVRKGDPSVHTQEKGSAS